MIEVKQILLSKVTGRVITRKLIFQEFLHHIAEEVQLANPHIFEDESCGGHIFVSWLPFTGAQAEYGIKIPTLKHLSTGMFESGLKFFFSAIDYHMVYDNMAGEGQKLDEYSLTKVDYTSNPVFLINIGGVPFIARKNQNNE